jgi:hypothetical protein
MGRGRHGGPFFCNERSQFFSVKNKVGDVGDETETGLASLKPTTEAHE